MGHRLAAIARRSGEVEQDFIAQYPVLTYGILGVILGFILLLCLFFLVGHAEPEWYKSLASRFTSRARGRERSNTLSSDKQLVLPTARSQARPNRLSALLSRVQAQTGASPGFSNGLAQPGAGSSDGAADYRGEMEGIKRSFESSAKGSIWSRDSSISVGSPGRMTRPSRQGSEVQVPQRAMSREELGWQPRHLSSSTLDFASDKGGRQATGSLRTNLRVETDLSKLPARTSSKSPSSLRLSAVASVTVPRTPSLYQTPHTALPHQSSPTPLPVPSPPKSASPRLSTPAPPSASPSSPSPSATKETTRISRPPIPQRISSSPAAHSPISPSNLRKSYVPEDAGAKVMSATRSSLVRPVTMLLTPPSSYSETRPGLRSAEPTPNMGLADTVEAMPAMPTVGDGARRSGMSDVDFSARHSYIVVASPVKTDFGSI